MSSRKRIVSRALGERTTPETRLQGGDVLVFSSEVDSIAGIWGTEGLEPYHGLHPREITTKRHSHRLVEVVVSRRAPAVGRKIEELPLPDNPIKASLIAISRGGRAIEGPMSQVRVQAGDISVLEVGEPFFQENYKEVVFALVRRLTEARIKRYDRALYATLITIAMVAVVAMSWMPMLNAALLASGAMILTGCMTFRNAGNSIEFKPWSSLPAP